MYIYGNEHSQGGMHSCYHLLMHILLISYLYGSSFINMLPNTMVLCQNSQLGTAIYKYRTKNNKQTKNKKNFNQKCITCVIWHCFPKLFQLRNIKCIYKCIRQLLQCWKVKREHAEMWNAIRSNKHNIRRKRLVETAVDHEAVGNRGRRKDSFWKWKHLLWQVLFKKFLVFQKFSDGSIDQEWFWAVEGSYFLSGTYMTSTHFVNAVWDHCVLGRVFWLPQVQKHHFTAEKWWMSFLFYVSYCPIGWVERWWVEVYSCLDTAVGAVPRNPSWFWNHHVGLEAYSCSKF